MKICFLSGDINRSGGTERVAINIANALVSQNKNNEVHILSIENSSNNAFFDINPDIILYNFLESDNNLKSIKKYLTITRKIRKYIIKNEIDVLIDIDTILSVFSLPAITFTKCKHIAWEHFTYSQNLGVKYRDWGRKLASKYSDAIIVLTKKDKQNFKKNLIPKASIYNIYNPLILEKNDIDYEMNSKIILSAGRLVNQKGFDLLIEVAKLVFNDHPSWKWYILGDGVDRQKIHTKIKEYNLHENIILKGNVNNIEDYYKKASLFVLTSRFEPFGLVLTEAKSFGLPCISFDVDAGPSEIILDNINGYLVEPYNIHEMAVKIKYLIENPNVRKEQSKSAMDDTDKFLINKIITQWEKLLHSVVK